MSDSEWAHGTHGIHGRIRGSFALEWARMGENSWTMKLASKVCADGDAEGMSDSRRLAGPKVTRVDDKSERTSKAKR